jgi:hypothetical protein
MEVEGPDRHDSRPAYEPSSINTPRSYSAAYWQYRASVQDSIIILGKMLTNATKIAASNLEDEDLLVFSVRDQKKK